MLNFLYGGGLTLPADTAGVAGNLLNYDQLEFVAGTPNLSSMNAQGFVYVPTACQQGASCRLHISFHGCLQARSEPNKNEIFHLTNLISLDKTLEMLTLPMPVSCKLLKLIT